MKISYFLGKDKVSECSLPLSQEDLDRILEQRWSDSSTDTLKRYLSACLQEPPNNDWTNYTVVEDDNGPLLPCPFCELRPEYEDRDFCYPATRDNNLWGAHCSESSGGCSASVLGSTKEDAIKQWNSRPKSQIEARGADVKNDHLSGLPTRDQSNKVSKSYVAPPNATLLTIINMIQDISTAGGFKIHVPSNIIQVGERGFMSLENHGVINDLRRLGYDCYIDSNSLYPITISWK